jgi:zinc/manganese transport system permease protein
VLAGYGVGLAGYVLGLLLSALLDLPTGAAIVCALAATGAVVAVARWRLGLSIGAIWSAGR